MEQFVTDLSLGEAMGYGPRRQDLIGVLSA
jgi:hypothetical protein